MNNKKTFDVVLEGKKQQIAVLRPTHKVQQQANLVFNKAFREAVEAGSLVRAKIDQVMRDQKIWDDERAKKYEGLVKSLTASEKKLAKGGIKMSEARNTALAMIRDRAELRSLRAERDELDQRTAESVAEQQRFSWLVANCTCYADSGKSYFQNVDQYLSADDDPVVLPAAKALGELIYNLDENWASKLPEWKFLTQYKFADDKLRLINSEGKFVDEQGRPVNEDGRRIDKDGNLIDSEGTPLTEEGDYKIDFQPFLEDEDSSPAKSSANVKEPVAA